MDKLLAANGAMKVAVSKSRAESTSICAILYCTWWSVGDELILHLHSQPPSRLCIQRALFSMTIKTAVSPLMPQVRVQYRAANAVVHFEIRKVWDRAFHDITVHLPYDLSDGLSSSLPGFFLVESFFLSSLAKSFLDASSFVGSCLVESWSVNLCHMDLRKPSRWESGALGKRQDSLWSHVVYYLPSLSNIHYTFGSLVV